MYQDLYLINLLYILTYRDLVVTGIKHFHIIIFLLLQKISLIEFCFNIWIAKYLISALLLCSQLALLFFYYMLKNEKIIIYVFHIQCIWKILIHV